MNDSRQWILGVGGLALATLAPSALLAQAGGGDEAPSEYIEVRVPYTPTSNTIATKLPVDWIETPANVGTVSGALMTEQGANLLNEALANVSGVHVEAGTGVHDFFVVRGFDSLTSGLVLLDGAPEPEVSFYPLYNVDAIEVLKGPSGFLYGSNPLSGVVNIVRKQPVPTDFSRFEIDYGTYESIDGRLDWNRAVGSGDSAFRLNGLWRESERYRDGQDAEHWAVNPSFTWSPSRRSSLVINLEAVEAEYTPDVGLPLVGGELPDVPRTRSYQTPFEFNEQELQRVQVDYEIRLGDRLTIRDKAYYRALDWESEGSIFGAACPDFATGNFEVVCPSFTTGRLEVSRFFNRLDDRQRFLGNQLEAVLTLGKGRVRHRILAGLELARNTDEFTLDAAFLPAIDLFDPVETATRESIFFVPEFGSAGDTESTIVAPYFVDQIELSDRLQVLLGARFDSISFEDTVSGTDRDDSELSPMVGLVWSPSSRLSLYANASESFAPPSARVAGEREPEESQQVEVGIKTELLDGRLRATLAAYDLERDNIAIPDETGFTQEAGDQQTRGFEFELAAEPRPRLRTFVSYAYQDAELTNFAELTTVAFDPFTFAPIVERVDRSGNVPAFAPEHLARVWISRSFRNGFGIAGGARWFSDQFIAEDNAFEIDGAVILDASLTYDAEPWQFVLRFLNLTDEEYGTRGFTSTSIIPADPFRITGGIRLNL